MEGVLQRPRGELQTDRTAGARVLGWEHGHASYVQGTEKDQYSWIRGFQGKRLGKSGLVGQDGDFGLYSG